ncbi:hypothetical protein [Enemella evansiae]|uniref:hypothetical protein n=1 Tax=Enemella evansiae TaxID=2016499 RepID=UPI0010D6CF2B|nr:hypothetical protein [Enemella evansiae]TDO91912.1 hypothetical protein C8D81_2228 [Enemella evansiae]
MKMRALAVLTAAIASVSFALPMATAQPAKGSASGLTVMAVDGGFCDYYAGFRPFCN